MLKADPMQSEEFGKGKEWMIVYMLLNWKIKTVDAQANHAFLIWEFISIQKKDCQQQSIINAS